MFRRQVLQSALLLPLATLVRSQQSSPATPDELMSAEYPVLPRQLAMDTIDAAHFDLAALKSILDARPALANCSMDWGFGDWETPLGAACHMGVRPIVEYLISKGARPTIFSAVILGQLELVKAFVAAHPGIQRSAGPHGITMLAHARIGGSAAMLEYVRSLGDADTPAPAPLGEAETKNLLGVYIFGKGPTDRVEVTSDPKMYGTKTYTYAPQLIWTREGWWDRALFHLGENVFYPAGAPSVRIRFTRDAGAMLMTVTDAETVLTGRRKVETK